MLLASGARLAMRQLLRPGIKLLSYKETQTLETKKVEPSFKNQVIGTSEIPNSHLKVEARQRTSTPRF